MLGFSTSAKTMQLTAEHRRALLAELDTAKENAAIQKQCLNKFGSDTETIGQSFEIGEFLAQQRIKLIEQSLITNEIDY